MDRALRFGRRGCGFESCRARKRKNVPRGTVLGSYDVIIVISICLLVVPERKLVHVHDFAAFFERRLMLTLCSEAIAQRSKMQHVQHATFDKWHSEVIQQVSWIWKGRVDSVRLYVPIAPCSQKLLNARLELSKT